MTFRRMPLPIGAGLSPAVRKAHPSAGGPGGEVLRVIEAAAAALLLLASDAAGRVTRWRVGMPPHVDGQGCV